MMSHKWTEEEKAYLAEITPGRSHKEIYALCQEQFDWKIPSVDTIKGAIHRYGLSTGRTGRFYKGQPGRNNGTKMLPEVYRKMAPTMYKKGNIPHNTHPIGTEVVNRDGYTFVKVSDDRTIPHWKNWKMKHRLIYEAAHGPIPEGNIVIFLDGDRNNMDLENLACISKSLNCIMSKCHLYSNNADVTRAGLKLAELKNARGRRSKK